MSAPTTVPGTTAPGPPLTPDALTARLAYSERVLAARAAPLLSALETLQYVVGVEMLTRLAEAALTQPQGPYDAFHLKLRSGSYAEQSVGQPPPGALPATVSGLFRHARLPKVYSAVPWWFGSVAQDLLDEGDGEGGCAALLRVARREGLTHGGEGPARPLTPADLGPETGLDEVGDRLRKATGWTLMRTAALLPGVLGLPELRRRWHENPQEGPRLRQMMEHQAAKAELLIGALERPLPSVLDTTLQRQRACHEILSRLLQPYQEVLPELTDALRHTPPAEDGAGLPRVLGLFMVAAPRLALPVRIRHAMTARPRDEDQALADWTARAEAEGLSLGWTRACLQRVAHLSPEFHPEQESR